jgi:hypothetical protein
MLGWALIINNLGRRRYPMYWWAAGKTFVQATPAAEEKKRSDELREVEAGLRSTEGDIFDQPSGSGEDTEDKNKVSTNRKRVDGGTANGAD